MMIKPYRFAADLTRGVILSRPNRFVMMVQDQSTGLVERCHCPATGNIGFLDFDKGGIPCLLSKNLSAKAKTSHTVEAISLQQNNDPDLSWIGINLTKSNRYVEHFLLEGIFHEYDCESGHMQDMRGLQAENVQREVKLGDSRIDFCLTLDDYSSESGFQSHYIEVKTPLGHMDTTSHEHFDMRKRKRARQSGISSRLPRHMNTLADAVTNGGSGISTVKKENQHRTRCTMLILFMYDAEAFKPPKSSDELRDVLDGVDYSRAHERQLQHVLDSAERMRTSGVVTWQLNLEITPVQVSFRSCFPL